MLTADLANERAKFLPKCYNPSTLRVFSSLEPGILTYFHLQGLVDNVTFLCTPRMTTLGYSHSCIAAYTLYTRLETATFVIGKGCVLWTSPSKRNKIKSKQNNIETLPNTYQQQRRRHSPMVLLCLSYIDWTVRTFGRSREL